VRVDKPKSVLAPSSFASLKLTCMRRIGHCCSAHYIVPNDTSVLPLRLLFFSASLYCQAHGVTDAFAAPFFPQSVGNIGFPGLLAAQDMVGEW
jgi:hypothetical protein